MGQETSVKYNELKRGKDRLQQINADLDFAKSYRQKMSFVCSEVGGATAGQAVCGFSSMYGKLISMMTALTNNTVTFLENMGVTFETADESAAKEIVK